MPPKPLALVRTQTSFATGRQPPIQPPKMIIRLLLPSYTATCPWRPGGEPDAPLGIRLVHCAGLLRPSPLTSTQVALVFEPVLDRPPNTITRPLAGSATRLPRASGGPPDGARSIHVGIVLLLGATSKRGVPPRGLAGARG